MPAFHFRLIPLIATLLVVAAGCGLSYWQIQRAHQKETIEMLLQQRAQTPPMALPPNPDIKTMEYARVLLTGHFEPHWVIYLDNRPMNGQAGITVLMPFRLDHDNQTVLVARGWLPRNQQNRSAIKPYQTPTGLIQIEGTLKAHNERVMQLGASAAAVPGALVQNLSIEDFRRASGLPVYPYLIEQTSAVDDGLLRDWPRASMGSERHRGYAFQWLALALTALLFFLFTSVGKAHGTKQT